MPPEESNRVFCQDCDYAKWTPKEFLNCYICECLRSDWYEKRMNGCELTKCDCFKRKDRSNDWIG